MNNDHLFMPIKRREHYRQVVDFLKAHREHLIASGARKRQLSTLDETIREMQVIVEMSTIYPLDEPPPKPVPVLPPQPLVMPGSEEFMDGFIETLVEDDA